MGDGFNPLIPTAAAATAVVRADSSRAGLAGGADGEPLGLFVPAVSFGLPPCLPCSCGATFAAAKALRFFEDEAKKRQEAAGERGKEGGRGHTKPSGPIGPEGLPSKTGVGQLAHP